jgi:CRISPR-associated endoribonuclease Cas6/Csy4 subtype I-F
VKLTAYIDIIARPGGEVTLHDVMSFIVQQLHHASKCGKIALAFPNMGKKPGLGDFVRAFAEDIETLNRVSDFLAENPRMDEYAIVRRPKQVPSGITQYECFSYFRLSHGLSESRRTKLGERGELMQQLNMKNRENRRATLRQLPFVTLYSSTTKSQFFLHVQRSSCEYSEAEPNGYGLSRKGQVLAIPVFD